MQLHVQDRLCVRTNVFAHPIWLKKKVCCTLPQFKGEVAVLSVAATVKVAHGRGPHLWKPRCEGLELAFTILFSRLLWISTSSRGDGFELGFAACRVLMEALWLGRLARPDLIKLT